MIERWSTVAVDGQIRTEPYLAPWPEDAMPYVHHIPAERRVFAFADGFPTPESALEALTTYLATVTRP